MFFRPQRAYQNIDEILGLPGGVTLKGMQDEAVPTQDLNRILQSNRVKRVLYTLSSSPAATGDVNADWAVAGDWTEIQVDGVLTVADADLPQTGQERIITGIALAIGGTSSEYTSAEAVRLMPTSAGTQYGVAKFGTLPTSQATPQIAPPWLLPQYLSPNEITMRFTQVVSGINADFFWVVTMIAAPRGVMSPYFGV